VAIYTESVRYLADFLAERGMPTAVAHLTREHVQAYLAHVLANRKASTASIRYRSLRFFDWCAEEGEIAESPMRNIKGPAIPEQQVPVLSDAVATPDGRLDVLDAGTLEPSGPALPGSDSPTQWLDLTADGHRLLVLDSDRSVRLADLRARQFLGDPIDLGAGALPNGDQWGGAILRDDGDVLAVYGVHGTVVWDLAPERLMAAVAVVVCMDVGAERRTHLALVLPPSRSRERRPGLAETTTTTTQGTRRSSPRRRRPRRGRPPGGG
jgi:hypothetical protein